MHVHVKPGWALPDSAATPESIFHGRRHFAKAVAAGSILAASGPLLAACDNDTPAPTPQDTLGLYPAAANQAYTLDRKLTPEKIVTTYNNFYEFGSQKNIWQEAQKLAVNPWTVKIDGLVEKEREVDFDALVQAMGLEERLYRHRCVEAWAIAVPWTGFPMRKLVEYAAPLSSAKYVRMETAMQPDNMSGLRQFWYPWPYIEGLTIAEATNEIAFIATGVYGKPAPKQNGAPLRLVTPWKYGFKSIKSLTRITFTDERPKTFWEAVGPGEYGFWANVNPKVSHPRWSQATERLLGENRRVPTQIYNGYGDYVAALYAGIEGERLFM